MCGVAQTRSMPSFTACRAIARLSARSSEPSSTPGRMWQCRSIIGANSVSGTGPYGHETTMIGMIQHLLPLGWREQLASTHG
jgi:hypothetical protein